MLYKFKFITSGSDYVIWWFDKFEVWNTCGVTIEREQLIRHARHENCDIHTLSWPDLPVESMDVRNCIRYKNTLKQNTSYICAVAEV